MRFLTVCILSISICHASVDAILENYPFSPNRRYGPSAQQSNKKLEEVRVVGYVQKGAKTYIFLRSEGKLRKVKVGDELDGVRLVGVRRGFLLLGDGNEIK
ncbi:MAG: hypothetical protein RMK75_04800, partial [Aquificaceae bacterium]|nr:hypothetical protein [Aquificaceae bacterium]MDW8423626.1 hypothetical protein [Aquificaceae bacterium]